VLDLPKVHIRIVPLGALRRRITPGPRGHLTAPEPSPSTQRLQRTALELG
jgi:hypothetical protein